ncbi:MAG TPA: cohesin domain-containing protein [Candidatus Cloacimonadota bacterium]|nr:cohesin domain-containing protein [Candidatus Cloacimonadota bacterium]HPS39391.1 cohesin domain-containing protein [Candidatus Cloacimonadota bacterium]
MKRLLLFILAVFISGMVFAQVRTCYDIQYTTAVPANSPYANQAVTVQGIVVAPVFYTGTSTTNYGFVISDPEGGPWRGLLVFTNRYFPELGDLVEVAGTVSEYYEFTELTSLSSYTVLSQGNPLPPVTVIPTSALGSTVGEQWESCMVKVENVTIASTPSSYNEFNVNDGSGPAQIDDQCFPRSGFTWPAMTIGQVWASIQGVVDWSFSYYGINPRNTTTDVVIVDSVQNASLRVQTVTAELNESINVPILTSRLKPAWGVSSYTAEIGIDPSKLEFIGLSIDECITNQMPPTPTISEDGTLITITYASQEPIISTTDDTPLIKLIFKPTQYGESTISIESFRYDNNTISSLTSGKVKVPIRESIAWLNLGTATSTKNIFDPALNEKLIIEYGAKTANSGINARVFVRIYDSKGVLVATPVNKVLTSALGIETYVYDGRDSNMKLLPVGVYYCSLEIVDRETGKKEKTVQPVVIRTTMK